MARMIPEGIMPDLPVLKPVPVSWMVSPSAPGLTISAAETDMKSPTTVELFVKNQDGTQSRVRLIFRHGLWVKWSLSQADAEVRREADYDWSRVPRLSTGTDYAGWWRTIQVAWTRTGRCPNPGMYEVRNSPWLKELDWPSVAGEDCRHYLILGHDICVEVVASGWHDEELTDRKDVGWS